MTKSIKQSVDSGKVGCGIFLDLQKAFSSTVNHKILLDKLEHYGIRGNVLKWFQSYLSGKTQYVTVNEHVSDPLPNTCVIRQGSVLGPLLFLIYVKDFPHVSKVMQFYLFADNNSIYFDSDNLFNLQKIINRELTLSHLGGRIPPPWETFLNNSKTAKDIKMKFFEFNLTLMGVILHIMTILIHLRCCHGNLLL